MKLIIVRHAQSEENLSGIIQGLLPGKLSDEGVNQAGKLGLALNNKSVDVIYCSPLNRCRQTLTNIQKQIDDKIPVHISALIQESDFGNLSGTHRDSIDFAKLDLDSAENRKNGVEPLESVKARTNKFLSHLKQNHPHDTVLVLSHSNPIKMLFSQLLGITYQEVLDNIKIKNCSLNIFEVNDTVKVISLNQTDHLE